MRSVPGGAGAVQEMDTASPTRKRALAGVTEMLGAGGERSGEKKGGNEKKVSV